MPPDSEKEIPPASDDSPGTSFPLVGSDPDITEACDELTGAEPLKHPADEDEEETNA
jgi:hypothetical protein